MSRVTSLLFLLATGCLITQDDHAAWLDQDGDNVRRDEDCDDHDTGVRGGADWFPDADGDGWGDESADALVACERPSGHTDQLGDCDDGSAAVHPGAEETWYDGVDANCDGASDYDQDGDGYDIEDTGLDCDDTDPDINPTAFEYVDGVDNDCDHDEDFIDLVESGVVMIGEEDADNTGVSVSGVGDVNGDGRDDMLVGTNHPATSDIYGKAFLVLGSISGELDLGSSAILIEGDRYRDKVGNKVSRAGDVNADGYDDFLVSGHKGGDDKGFSPGEAYLFHGAGSLTAMTVDEAAFTIQGVNSEDMLGYDLAGGGDLDGDGLSDLAITAIAYASERGKVYVVLGANAPTGLVSADDVDFGITGENADDRAGRGVAMGDLTGDGFDELLIGSKENDRGATNSGTVYIFDYAGSPVDQSLDDASAIIAGSGTDDYAGGSMSVGDLDGDGYGDLLVGAEKADGDAGAVYMVSGVSALTTTTLDKVAARVDGDEDCNLGRSVAILGDINADDVTDVALGGPACDLNGDGSGGIFVMLDGLDGVMSLDDASFALAGEGSDHRAGWSVSAAGDVNADGFHDILVGAYDAGSGPGMAYVFFGGDY